MDEFQQTIKNHKLNTIETDYSLFGLAPCYIIYRRRMGTTEERHVRIASTEKPTLYMLSWSQGHLTPGEEHKSSLGKRYGNLNYMLKVFTSFMINWQPHQELPMPTIEDSIP